MKRILLTAVAALLVLLAQSASAQVLYTTTNDFRQFNGGAGTVSSTYYSDSSILNGIGNANPGGVGGIGSLQLTATGGWNGWLPGSDFPWPTSNSFAALAPGSTLPTGAFVAHSGIITFDVYQGNFTNWTTFGVNFNYDGYWGPFWATSATGFTGADGRTWTRYVVPYTINANTNVTYFGMALAQNGAASGQLFYVDNFAMYTPPPTPTTLFTTTNDFAGWSTGGGFTNVAPTAAVDLDGVVTNGLGNAIDPGAVGTPGSLSMKWVSGNFDYPTSSPNLSGNTALIYDMLHAQAVTFDFTMPDNNGGNYFQFGMLINCDGRYDHLWPSSVTLVSNNIYRASIDWSTEAPALINQQALSGFSYFYIGFVYNSNYSPTNTFYVDNIAPIVPPPAPSFVASSALASESCSPANGVLDPGETVTLNVALKNMGTAEASNVVATLLATGGVTSPSGAQSYGTLLPGATTVTNSFTFTVDSTCGSTLTATLLLQTNSVSMTTTSLNFQVGILGGAVTNTYSSGAISVSIPDNDLVGITNTITVGSAGVVSKVVVSIRMNHTYDGDVAMNLVHPDGTVVELIAADPGNSGQDFGTGATDCAGTYTVFNDSASTPIAAGSGPYAGSYIPRQSLGAMNGKSAQGNWKLVVSDSAAGDVGTLYCWQVQIAYQPYTCCSGGGPADPFTTWQFAYFGSTNSANSLPSADPDGDGEINTNEFAAGFNPTNNAASLKIISVVNSAQDVRVTYLGANGDGVLSPGPKTNVLESAAGTSNGSYSNNFVSTGQTNILTGGSGAGVVTNMIDSGGATNRPSRYYRVRVLTP